MREHLNMACTDRVRPADLPADNATMKRKNWRNRIGLFLKSNSSQSTSHHLKNKSYRPTADEVTRWAQSLDQLLSHKYGKAAFCVFLKSEFCEENIEFWTACEDFKALSSPRDMASKANSIYEEFVRSEAPKEINLDFHTKNAIVQNLHQPTTTFFLAAQGKIYSLMENNSYMRFIHSDLYKDLCVAAAAAAAAGGEAKHAKS